MIPVNKKFDVILGGGLMEKTIIHVYGPPASGKTNIALIAAANAALNKKVIYVDTEGGFSVERLQQIAGKDSNKVLGNIMMIEPSDYDEQKVAIRKLSDIVQKVDAGLVIVDSLSALYRLEEEKDTKELGRQIAQLLRIAKKYNIPVLITNQVYTDMNTREIVSVGGDVLKYWAKVAIELGKNEQNHLRYAILRKHKFLPEGMRLEFKIVDSGIEVVNYSEIPKGVIVREK
jgi:DNA repair protein RadB